MELIALDLEGAFDATQQGFYYWCDGENHPLQAKNLFNFENSPQYPPPTSFLFPTPEVNSPSTK